MKCTLTTQEKLKDLREERNLKLEAVAAATGLSSSTIGNYENDEYKEMQPSILQKLADFYNVPVAYLYGITDNLTESETSIDELHLDDDTVRILKEKKINNRLLCEVIKHPSFGNLMSDLEIYVDNIAGSYIDYLNLYITTARDNIKKRADVPDDDYYMKTMEKSIIDGDEYFGDLLESDLKKIAKDIRASHKKDWDTGDEISIGKDIVESINKLVEAHASGKLSTQEPVPPIVTTPTGSLLSHLDKATITKWSQTCGLNLKVYTDEELNSLVYLVKKGSKHSIFRNPPMGRGKKH
jgi:transcriptional regulator with XRE-family HTH domain